MIAWCRVCNRAVLPQSGRCPGCGNGFGESTGDDYFVSGAGTGPSGIVEIPVDSVLFDRFRIVKRLGNGSSGTVYLAHDRLTHLEVALKIGEALGECSVAQRLIHEVRVRQHIQDFQYVLPCLGVHAGLWGGSEVLAVVLKYADGGTLRDWIQGHAGDVFARSQHGLELLKQGMRGLAVLNDAGIVHLDVKPENFFVVAGTLMIGDLAAALCLDRREWSGQVPMQLDLRHAGTPEYMSPEQIETPDPSSLDARCNVFSIGVILYELLHSACRRPFDGTTNSRHSLHRSMAPARLEGVDSCLASIVSQCVERDPDARPQTMWEVLDALDGSRLEADAEERVVAPDVHESHPEVQVAVPGFECAWAAFEQGELPEAQQLCKRILVQDTHHGEAADLLQDIERRDQDARIIYQRLAGAFDTLNLEEAGALLQTAEEVYPNHPAGASIRPSFVTRCAQYSQVVEDAQIAFRSGVPGAALPPLRKAASLNPGEPLVEQIMDSVGSVAGRQEQAQHSIQEALVSGEYERALVLAASLDSFTDESLARFAPGEE